MPTYFFDLIKGNELVEDDQGDDFADIEAAKLEGLASARELLADAAKKGILATSTSISWIDSYHLASAILHFHV